jgi:hypothetical protein
MVAVSWKKLMCFDIDIPPHMHCNTVDEPHICPTMVRTQELSKTRSKHSDVDLVSVKSIWAGEARSGVQTRGRRQRTNMRGETTRGLARRDERKGGGGMLRELDFFCLL